MSVCGKFAADGLEIEYFLYFKGILNFISVATNLKEWTFTFMVSLSTRERNEFEWILRWNFPLKYLMCKIKSWNPGTVLVTFLLYGLEHYDQRQLLEENIKWRLAVSEGKSMAIMIGIVVEVGRPGARVRTESPYLIHLKQR